MQTQRQLQVSLETHGRYISSLIDSEAVPPVANSDPLLDNLPSLELDLEDLPAVPVNNRPDVGAAENFDHRWMLGHSTSSDRPAAALDMQTVSVIRCQALAILIQT